MTRTVELIDGPPLTILSGVDLDVAVGDRVSVVGRSGSGKSTLLKLVTGVVLPDEGTVEVVEGVAPLIEIT
ncbi:ATP-binding cassette domain-containing protein, partial [Microbacterium sp. ER1]|uniref:ATP-binding cassette domain-containing protein n=1 Tax=Microbacterium sp. ER1 TaxID=1932846 RepID=UPI0035AC1A28